MKFYFQVSLSAFMFSCLLLLMIGVQIDALRRRFLSAECVMFVYALRLMLFMLVGITGNVEGDFIYASFLKVSCQAVKRPKHFFETNPRDQKKICL